MLEEMWCEDYSHVVIPGFWNYDLLSYWWRNGFQNWKVQKAKIKEELMPIA